MVTLESLANMIELSIKAWNVKTAWKTLSRQKLKHYLEGCNATEIAKTLRHDWTLEDAFFKQRYKKQKQENVPSHAPKYSTGWLASKGYKDNQMMTCLPCSAILNPFENLHEVYSKGKQYLSEPDLGVGVTTSDKNEIKQMKKRTDSMNVRLMQVSEKRGCSGKLMHLNGQTWYLFIVNKWLCWCNFIIFSKIFVFW